MIPVVSLFHQAVQSRNPRTVTLTQSSEGLGMDIIGLTHMGLFVNSIKVGGTAERSGQIQQGDQVLVVNGKCCGG